jgi:cyclohexanone monooxygenase
MQQERAEVLVLDAVVVGAGFAGMYAVHHLSELGFRVLGFEAGNDVGGTWYWNRYPGARCDIPSVEYSYSWSEDLQQEWVWTKRYPDQQEMLRYARHVADRFGLRRHFVFGTRVISAHYQDDTGDWRVTTDRDHDVRARYCIMATGCLSVPRIPELVGLDDFRGRVLHTAAWPDEGVDVAGQRVGVIGTGASGIQVIPPLAKQAAHLTVFQRTAQFSVSGSNRPLDPEELRAIKANYQENREYARRSFGGTMLRANKQSALEVSEAERTEQFERAWSHGGFAFLASFRDITTDERANHHAAEFVRHKIRSIVHDPDTAAMLLPTDHPLGTKRICVDDGYYATFNRPNVSLVDLRRTPLVTVTTDGVRTSERDYRLETLVLATGFDAMTGALLSIDIRGRNGQSLRQAWQDGPCTYLGLAISGFPNLFTVTGPGSPSVLSNVIAAGEQHVEWIGRLLTSMRDRGLSVVEADQAAQDAWTEHVNQVAAGTLYPRADSWYVGANVPGKPRIFMPYVGGVGNYRRRCDQVADNGYQGFSLRPAPARSVSTDSAKQAAARPA